MSAGTPRRSLAIVGLVLIALLGSAYALGRTLVGDPFAAPTTRPSHQADVAGQPAPTSASPETTPSVEADEPTEEEGPYGTQTTTGNGDVALTFDDGPDPLYTPQALQVLREYGVKATFCLVGEKAQAYPDLVRAIVADGHTLCNHSWNHDFLLGSRPHEWIQTDLLRTNEVIRAAVPDAPIAYYRQPGGAWTYPVVSVAQQLGMIPLHWTVDPMDWEAPGASSIAGMVTASAVPGSIVLLHDAGGDRQGTIDALYTILPNLISRFRVAALPPTL